MTHGLEVPLQLWECPLLWASDEAGHHDGNAQQSRTTHFVNQEAKREKVTGSHNPLQDHAPGDQRISH